MKKNIFLSVLAMMSFTLLNANPLSNEQIHPSIGGSSAFIDASSRFSTEATGVLNDVGKGLVFPTVDLTTFQFVMDNVSRWDNFPTMFNGMIVYNSATGETSTEGARSSVSINVEPGFYFFYNPRAIELIDDYGYSYLDAVRAGQWRRIGDGGANNAWLVGGNMATSEEPMVLGIHEDSDYLAPIIIYAPVRNSEGVLERRGIMHIGQGAMP